MVKFNIDRENTKAWYDEETNTVFIRHIDSEDNPKLGDNNVSMRNKI